MYTTIATDSFFVHRPQPMSCPARELEGYPGEVLLELLHRTQADQARRPQHENSDAASSQLPHLRTINAPTLKRCAEPIECPEHATLSAASTIQERHGPQQHPIVVLLTVSRGALLQQCALQRARLPAHHHMDSALEDAEDPVRAPQSCLVCTGSAWVTCTEDVTRGSDNKVARSIAHTHQIQRQACASDPQPTRPKSAGPMCSMASGAPSVRHLRERVQPPCDHNAQQRFKHSAARELCVDKGAQCRNLKAEKPLSTLSSPRIHKPAVHNTKSFN